MPPKRRLIREEKVLKGDRKHGTRIGQEKNAFKNRWGRERFPGEPGSPDNPWEGFLVQVFKPTPEDNGKVAIGGFMYDPQKFEYNGMISTNFFADHNKETLRLYSLFPRDVVATMDQNEKIFDLKQLLTIAAYFRRFDIPIESKVIDGFVRKLQHTRGVDFSIVADKQKKQHLIMKDTNYDDTRKFKFYVLAERRDNIGYNKFVGELILKDFPGRFIGETKDFHALYRDKDRDMGMCR